MAEYHEYAGDQFDVQVTHVGAKVTLSFYRGGTMLVQLTMPYGAGAALARDIMGMQLA